MKRFYYLVLLYAGINTAGLIYSCKKENASVYTPPPPPPPPPPAPPITTTYLENFSNSSVTMEKGWFVGEFIDDGTWNSGSGWSGGFIGTVGKGEDSTVYGFSAFSFQDWNGEFFYSFSPQIDRRRSFARWLLTPILSAKNGDSITFYTRGDTTGTYTNRMQVILNKLGTTDVGSNMNTTGEFKTVVLDINPTQEQAGYPTIWTKYTYTFSGLTDVMNIRIGFRHFAVNPINARGVGIDEFRFDVK